MARFTGFDEVFSALYVDFDNIYTRFLEADPEAARTFGSAPYRWVRWIENHALRILSARACADASSSGCVI